MILMIQKKTGGYGHLDHHDVFNYIKTETLEQRFSNDKKIQIKNVRNLAQCRRMICKITIKISRGLSD